MERTNVTTPPGVPVVPTDPVVRPPDNNSDLPNTHVLFILLTVLAFLVELVVLLFMLKRKILPKTFYNGQTHSQTSKWCPPCKMCYGTLCYSGRYEIASTAQRSSENSNTDKHLQAGTKLHNRPVSLVSRDSAYETGSLKREENRQSLTNVTFRNQGLSGDDACCLHDFGRNTAESAGPTDKSDTSLYYVNETNNQGDITNQDVDVGRRSESSRQSESKENKLKVDRNEPTVGVHKGPTNTAAKKEDVNKKAGNQSSGKSIDGNQSSAAASGKGRDSVRKKDSDRRQAEVKTSQPQGNTNTDGKVTENNGQPSVNNRESRTKPSNKIPEDGKNSKTGDRKPGDDHSKQDAKASDNKIDGGRKPSNNSTAKTGGKGDVRLDRNRKHSGNNATDTKKIEKSSQQNPRNHRAQTANFMNKPSVKTENKKKETVVMQPTPDVVDPNNDPNRLQLDLFSNVFIPKEEPRTAMGDTNKYGLVGAAQLESPLHANEENDAPLSIQYSDHRESQKRLSEHQPLLAHPPSEQIIDGGESHVNSPALPSHLNNRGCGSVVGGAAAGEESLTASQEFRRITEQHMAERGIVRWSSDQLDEGQSDTNFTTLPKRSISRRSDDQLGNIRHETEKSNHNDFSARNTSRKPSTLGSEDFTFLAGMDIPSRMSYRSLKPALRENHGSEHSQSIVESSIGNSSTDVKVEYEEPPGTILRGNRVTSLPEQFVQDKSRGSSRVSDSSTSTVYCPTRLGMAVLPNNHRD